MIFFYIIRQVAPKIINLEQRHEGLAEISASPSFLHIYTFILNFIYLETDLKHSILHRQDVIGKKLIKSSHSLIKIGLKRTLDMILLSSPNLEAERTFPW